MPDTPRLALPLLDGGQAQKHVTVNEALALLDAFGAAAVVSRTRATPPAAPADGALHVVGAGGQGDWAGRDGALAAFLNGGWAFRAPEPGRRVHVRDEGAEAVFDGARWVEGRAAGRAGAATLLRVVSIDHAIAGGASSATAPFIPDKAVVIGVTGRVLETVRGAGLTGWRLGVAGAPGRYGAGYGLAAGSFAQGVTTAPTAYFGGAGLVLEAEGGVFEGGIVRLAAHLLEVEPPA
jgi:hypothetical protein